jgi:5-methyltetrahydropteroyltriglutamate--homocysteine methyltransferase
LLAKERGEPKAPQFEAEVNRAVEAVVADQVAAGIDVVSDGEMSKCSYTFYAKDRMKGITRGGRFRRADFP